MGEATTISLEQEDCALIHTGGMLPAGANAVVMVELTQQVRENEIEVLKPVADGENVLKIGEDVSPGAEVIPTGRQLRPSEIGGLMALGITQVKVVRQPIVGVISTGDEVIHPEREPQPGQVRDINAYTLSALVQSTGGKAVRYGIAPDNENKLFEMAAIARDECDFVIITAGSSASTRDLTAQVVNRLGKPGVLVHGVNVRPGKPTILGVCGGKGIVGLPGNPVSALVIANLFIVPAIKNAMGIEQKAFKPGIWAELSVNISSQSGREDWVPVQIISRESRLTAEPVFGKSNLIFTLVRADGLVRIPETSNGLNAGENVYVYPLHRG
jgi:molybdopterin molybdotransferase